MAHRIALYCFDGSVDVPRLASALRTSLSRRGFQADVGLPGDEASAKSWHLSVVLHSLLRPALDAFDLTAMLTDAGVPEASVKVVKSWVFDD